MAKQVAKKAGAKKNTKTLVRKATKTVSEKVVKLIKPKAPTESEKKNIGFFELGKTVGELNQKAKQEIQKQQMQAGPAITARVSFELDEVNNCKINVSGDFNVILKKMHEIQDQSIKIDKEQFFKAALLMKGEQK